MVLVRGFFSMKIWREMFDKSLLTRGALYHQGGLSSEVSKYQCTRRARLWLYLENLEPSKLRGNNPLLYFYTNSLVLQKAPSSAVIDRHWTLLSTNMQLCVIIRKKEEKKKKIHLLYSLDYFWQAFGLNFLNWFFCLFLCFLECKTNDWVRSKINFLVGPQESLLATV